MTSNNITAFLEQRIDLCTGCSACSAICPNNAIRMILRENGFWYPDVENALCCNCGLCKKVCIARIRESI